MDSEPRPEWRKWKIQTFTIEKNFDILEKMQINPKGTKRIKRNRIFHFVFGVIEKTF